jgi:hypothetical protein
VGRLRIGGLAGFGALALVLSPATAPPRPLELVAPTQEARFGLVSNGSGAFLLRLHPVSLKRTGRAVDLKGFAGVWAFSPDRRRLAMALRQHPSASAETLRFVTVARRGLARGGIFLGGPAAALTWARSGRILAYVNEVPNGDPKVLAIDPGSRRVVARVSVDGSVLHGVRGPNSLVLLVGETNRIGPVRLVVVDADGASHSVKLDGIAAGRTWPDERTADPVGTRIVPGLTLDGAGRRAFVISPDGSVAVVNLGSFAVSYHRWEESRPTVVRLAGWLTPAAEAKGMSGPALTAGWLGDDLLAIAGSDENAVHEGDKLRISRHPLGLRIVDTRDWSAQLLDAGADAFTVADGVLLATGSSWTSEPQAQSGMGVAAYGSDRTRRFQLLAGRAAWVGFVYRGRAYVSVADESPLRVVDLASGRIVGTRRAEAPWPLLGESASFFR